MGRNNNHSVGRVIAAAAIAVTSLLCSPQAAADISPQYPPGRYHAVQITCVPEQPCPPIDWGYWTVIDAGPGLIRMITQEGAVLDFQRFETGWTALSSALQYECLSDGSPRTAHSQFTIFDTGGNILIIDDWSPEYPFCDGIVEDTASELQLTREDAVPFVA